jgi:hypothetical protein
MGNGGGGMWDNINPRTVLFRWCVAGRALKPGVWLLTDLWLQLSTCRNAQPCRKPRCRASFARTTGRDQEARKGSHPSLPAGEREGEMDERCIDRGERYSQVQKARSCEGWMDGAVAMLVMLMLRVFSSTVTITDGETRYMCAYKQDLTGNWRETSHINLFACQKP